MVCQEEGCLQEEWVVHTNNLVEGYLLHLSEGEWKDMFRDVYRGTIGANSNDEIDKKIAANRAESWYYMKEIFKKIVKSDTPMEQIKKIVKMKEFYIGFPILIASGIGIVAFAKVTHAHCAFEAFAKYPTDPTGEKSRGAERAICYWECVKRVYLRRYAALKNRLTKCEKARDVIKCKEKIKKQIAKIVLKIKKCDDKINHFKEIIEKYRTSK